MEIIITLLAIAAIAAIITVRVKNLNRYAKRIGYRAGLNGDMHNNSYSLRSMRRAYDKGYTKATARI